MDWSKLTFASAIRECIRQTGFKSGKQIIAWLLEKGVGPVKDSQVSRELKAMAGVVASTDEERENIKAEIKRFAELHGGGVAKMLADVRSAKKLIRIATLVGSFDELEKYLEEL